VRPGEAVALVSPSGPASRERVEFGVAMLTSWGLEVAIAPGAFDRNGYLAGTDETRLADLNAALRDPAIRGIICTRGGYGAQRIVDGIDMDAVRADPKIIAGFSDITALQLAVYQHAGVASLQSPMLAWNAERTGENSANSLRDALMTTDPVVLSALQDQETYPVRIPGPPVTGTLLGGNLCLIAATVGTRDLPDLAGAILLIEDVNEPPYKVDRMLTHLRRSGALDGVAGFAVGQFTGCADGWSTTVVDVLTERLGALDVPVLGGLPTGHGTGQLSVPVGVPAILDVSAGTLTAESAGAIRRTATPSSPVPS
jgi:muramoyltetrapeptide carboxypeptidase